ncbi:HeH/LEM domain protein [Acinetobacter pittii]|uniref:HeH/LEM domain protein n=1 Tax=Acinetobacter pittii TaxID=48296 RepID=UPI001EFDF0CE|nr:HeH/LEM domain protein [Acinetobacter pittii]MCG9515164.1 HeH/LEM domain protein [Acinetobacter pittii]
MKVIYTNTLPENRDHNACYRTSFLGVIGEASYVHVEDDFPDAEMIKQAYGHLAVPKEYEALAAGSIGDLKLQKRLDEALGQVEVLEAENTRLEGELASFKNDIPAMQARIAEIEAGKGTPDPLDGPKQGDYENWKVDQIKAYLTDKGIDFKQSALKPELIALIPQELKE